MAPGGAFIEATLFHEGDIVEIPLPDGRTAVGWILHVSRRFKDCVGFIVLGLKGQLRNDVVYDVATGNPLSMKVLGLFYTHIDVLEHYGWKNVAHQPISESKKQLTKRKVGGGVYVGDDYLGSAEELGERNLKQMQVMGMSVIYQEIEKAFGTC
jgi:hypothetical protein